MAQPRQIFLCDNAKDLPRAVAGFRLLSSRMPCCKGFTMRRLNVAPHDHGPCQHHPGPDRGWAGVLLLVWLLAACGQGADGQGADGGAILTQTTTTLTGTRLTRGDAVDCPTLRDAAGGVQPVSCLSPALATGARGAVTGFCGAPIRGRGRLRMVRMIRCPRPEPAHAGRRLPTRFLTGV